MSIVTSIQALDRILGGGIKENCNIALVGSIDNDYVLLMHQIVNSILSQGKKVLLVEFREDPNSLLEWLKDYGIDYAQYMERKQLRILDGFTNVYSQTQVSKPDILPNPLDLSITSAIIRDAVSKEKYDFVVLDDITTLYPLQPDPRGYIRVTIRLVNSLKSRGASVIGGINKDVLPIQDLTMILIPFEYVVEVMNGIIRVKRSYSPLTTPIEEINYVKSKKGIVDVESAFNNVYQMRDSITLKEDGSLMLGNLRVQIIDEFSEASLIKFVYMYLGPEKGKEFLYKWGKFESKELKLPKSSKEKARQILEDMFTTTKITGGGILNFVSFEDDIIVIEGKNLFPRLKNFPYPAHVNYAGSIAGIVEKLLGGEWKGDEISCESQGHEKCLFVIRKVSDSKSSEEEKEEK